MSGISRQQGQYFCGVTTKHAREQVGYYVQKPATTFTVLMNILTDVSVSLTPVAQLSRRDMQKVGSPESIIDLPVVVRKEPSVTHLRRSGPTLRHSGLPACLPAAHQPPGSGFYSGAWWEGASVQPDCQFKLLKQVSSKLPARPFKIKIYFPTFFFLFTLE